MDAPFAAAEDALFVYGTLMSGGANGWRLAGCRRAGQATVSGTLYDLGEYPALVPGGTGRVAGELWVCPSETLRRLDTFEGVGEGLFLRTRIDVGGASCWTYVAGPILRPALKADRVVSSGRWARREGEGD